MLVVPPAPTSLADAIQLLHVGGTQYARPSIDAMQRLLPTGHGGDIALTRGLFFRGMRLLATATSVEADFYAALSSPPIPEVALADVVSVMSVGGPSYIKPAVLWLEANLAPGDALVKRAHGLLNHAGYLAEDLCGVPDGTFGAGGTDKPPG